MEKSVDHNNLQDNRIESLDDDVEITNNKQTEVESTQDENTLNKKEQLGLITFIQSQLSLPNIDVKTYSPLTLAFIGDVVYDLIIRTMVVEQGNAPVNKLHKKVSNLVKATAQVELLHKVEDMLTEEEISMFKRGRNAKSFTSAKNASITEYRIATGLEALIGYLYLDNQFARILDIIQVGLKE